MGYIEKLAKRHKEYYSKDSIVAHLTKVEKELKFKIGLMKSEIDELRYENKQLEIKVKKLTKEPFKDKKYKEIKNKLRICKFENNLLNRKLKNK